MKDFFSLKYFELCKRKKLLHPKCLVQEYLLYKYVLSNNPPGLRGGLSDVYDVVRL